MHEALSGKVKCWIDPKDIEDSAIEQINNMVELEPLYKHLAIMPDVHCGYGATIGSVLPLDGAIIPNAVGYDIGCGMCAVQTTALNGDFPGEDLEEINKRIQARIPVGFNHRTKSQYDDVHKYASKNILDQLRNYQERLAFIRKDKGKDKSLFAQLGTLGGGNHFIEIQEQIDAPHAKARNYWIMLHSGSRNVGHTLAGFHMKVAQDINKRYKIGAPKDLEYLGVDTIEGQNYIEDMNFALEFARQNRFVMVDIVKDIMSDVLGCDFSETINIHHNYAALENHFGQNVWVHRKGATRVRKNTIGIIPGSMGSYSYIVSGTNNDESFHSCSHGAGRAMSRTKAKQSITIEQFEADTCGLISDSITPAHLDEAPGAYKNISDVMENQKELVKIEHELIPVVNIKG